MVTGGPRGRVRRPLLPVRCPNLAQLRRYERAWLRGDVAAGLTVAAYMIPQVMAYAVVAGLPPVAGLWAAVPALGLYAVLGSSRRLSVGPESTTALLSASVVAPLAHGDPARFASLTALLTLIFGAYCVLGRLLRLGFIADLLSRPVLVGYLAGLAVVMVLGQLTRVTGVPVEGDSAGPQALSFLRNVGDARMADLAVAGATLVLLLALRARAPRLPGPLLAIVLVGATVAVLHLQDRGVAVVGGLHGGLPRPGVPSLQDAHLLLLPALGILVVGYVDNILTARSFAARADEELDANQELLALGTANLGSGLLHGFPVSSSASRTALGDATGAKSQLYSLVCLGVLLATLLVGAPVLSRFPQAALGALVVYAAARLVEVGELRRLARFRRRELLLALATLVGVVTVDILYGVLIAVGLSVADLLSRVARPHDAVLGLVDGLAGMHDVDDYPAAVEIPGLVVYRYDSPLFFANAEDFKRRALAAVDGHRDTVEWFLLNAEANVEVDITGLDALESLRSTLAERGIVVALARVKQDLYGDLKAYGLVDAVGADHIYPTLPTALEAFAARRAATTPVPRGEDGPAVNGVGAGDR
jgi:high affinity sulfate transporter 1